MKLSSIFAALAVTAVHLTSNASPVIDQQNASSTFGGFCYLNPGVLCGQSFTQSAGNIAGAGFQIAPYYGGSNENLTVSIYGNYGSTPSQLVASGVSGIVTPLSNWVDVFWTPVSLIAGNTYYMVISGHNGLVAAFTTSSYAHGNALYGGNSTTYANYDLAFRTYSDSAFGAAAVPEPVSLGLLGIGLLGLCLSRKKPR